MARLRAPSGRLNKRPSITLTTGIPLVNVMTPENFIPLISIVITDSQGHTMREGGPSCSCKGVSEGRLWQNFAVESALSLQGTWNHCGTPEQKGVNPWMRP